MAQLEEKEIETILRRFMSSKRQVAGGTNCLTGQVLAEYLSGQSGEETLDMIEGHVAVCSACADVIVAAYKAAQDSGIETCPQRVIDKAMALIPAEDNDENFLDVVVRLVLDSIELVTTSGELVPAAAGAEVRGKTKSTDNGILQVDKALGEFKIAVEVERIEDNLCQVAVRVKPQNGSVAEGIRLSLMSGGREQASYLARQGTATFDRVPPGDYRLEVSDSRHSVGSIRLTIKESPNGR